MVVEGKAQHPSIEAVGKIPFVAHGFLSLNEVSKVDDILYRRSELPQPELMLGFALQLNAYSINPQWLKTYDELNLR